MKTKLFFMIGPTNVGKSYLADAISNEYPGTYRVSVGKLLRAKYGEAFFNGQAAPEHTESEALKLMDTSISQGIKNRCPIVLIDGQPRSIRQVNYITSKYFDTGKHECNIILLSCIDLVRMERLKKRDTTPYKLELSLSRFNDDMIHLYNVVYSLVLNHWGGNIIPIDNSHCNPLNQFKDFVNFSDEF